MRLFKRAIFTTCKNYRAPSNNTRDFLNLGKPNFDIFECLFAHVFKQLKVYERFFFTCVSLQFLIIYYYQLIKIIITDNVVRLMGPPLCSFRHAM